MKVSILTLFPEMFQGPFDFSIIKRAKERGLVKVSLVNIRDFGIGKHKMVDDTPYGGGVGMVMRVDVIHSAIEYAKSTYSEGVKLYHPTSVKAKIILLSAGGKTFNQKKANEFSKLDHLILICGHYEGVDERISQYVDEEISVGDFVLTGGEIPAMLITDTVSRLISGVITKGAIEEESFSKRDEGHLLEYPHFTKPQEYDSQNVPDVLLTGDHKKIKDWRLKKAIEKTKKLRPDLIKR